MTKPTSPDFTVCVLLYGDYPELARRCLNPRLLALPNVEFRVGLNEVGPQTQQFVDSLVLANLLPPAGIYRSAVNIRKYPMMRRMFYERPLTTPYTMWFDDDSYLLPRVDPATWLNPIRQYLAAGITMLGSLYTMRLSPPQCRWVEAQSWYGGQTFGSRYRVRFCTGGFWAIRTTVLQEFNWPIPELNHNGGDSMLGELCRQQNLVMKGFRTGVAINADAFGNESKAKRRGYTSPPIGHDYRGNTT